MTFLARDGAAGWADLCRIVTAAHAGGGPDSGPGRQPLLLRPDNHAEGLTVLLGPASDVGRALAAGRPDRAAKLLAPWREIYGDALRLEAVWHGREGTGPGSLRLAARTVGFAAEQRVRPVLSNAVRYADPGLGPVADVLDAARRLVPVDPRRELDSGEAWLKGEAAMLGAAERIVEAAGYRRDTAHRLLEQTQATAAECLVDPEDDLGIGTVHFPEPHLVGAGRRTAQRVLASRAAAGMVLRGYDGKRAYWERMHRELDIIAHHDFASYFLTVAQVVDDVRKMGIRVAARGSGAGSLVNHLLGIAHADPVEHGLLMERFLSKRRSVLPDIDIDVESARRLEVYRAIIDRFGTERVATVSMPETYRVRHAVRDVGAALSMDPADIDRIAKSFPHIRARDARAAMDELPELRELAREVQRKGEKYGRLWELVESSTPSRAASPCTRAGAPLRRLPARPYAGRADQRRGFPMSQFDKEDVEDLGLLKLDVLGVRMQSAMAHAVAEVQRATGTGRTSTRWRRATRRPIGSSSPPRRWAVSRSSRPDSATWSDGCSPRPSTTSSSTSRSSGRDRSPPTWCGRSSRRGTGGRRSAIRTRTWRTAEGDVRRRGLPRADHRHRRHHDRLRTRRGGPGAARAVRPRVAGRIRFWFAQNAAAKGTTPRPSRGPGRSSRPSGRTASARRTRSPSPSRRTSRRG